MTVEVAGDSNPTKYPHNNICKLLVLSQFSTHYIMKLIQVFTLGNSNHFSPDLLVPSCHVKPHHRQPIRCQFSIHVTESPPIRRQCVMVNLHAFSNHGY